MASPTLQIRLERLDAYLNMYIKTQKLPIQFKIKKIERARDFAFRGIISSRDFMFRKTASVSDGSNYPADMISYANNAFYTLNGNIVTFAFINIQEVGQAFNNIIAKGLDVSPKIFFSDQKIRTSPSGISGITFEYISKPTPLFTNPIDLTLTDNMPEDMEDVIIRGAFERTLGQLRTDRDALELAGIQQDEANRAAANYYKDYYQKNVLAGGGLEIAG